MDTWTHVAPSDAEYIYSEAKKILLPPEMNKMRQIRLPKGYYQFLPIVLGLKHHYDEEMAVLEIFEEGIEVIEDALKKAKCRRAFRKWLCNLSLLKGRQTAIEILDYPNYLERMREMGEEYNMSVSNIATIIFLAGLFEYCDDLKISPSYKTDTDFRKKVDAMSNTPWFEPLEEDLDEDDIPWKDEYKLGSFCL